MSGSIDDCSFGVTVAQYKAAYQAGISGNAGDEEDAGVAGGG